LGGFWTSSAMAGVASPATIIASMATIINICFITTTFSLFRFSAFAYNFPTTTVLALLLRPFFSFLALVVSAGLGFSYEDNDRARERKKDQPQDRFLREG
jgi:hypothetical protein